MHVFVCIFFVINQTAKCEKTRLNSSRDYFTTIWLLGISLLNVSLCLLSS